MKKLAVKFKGNEILGVDDADIFACNRDLWKTERSDTRHYCCRRQPVSVELSDFADVLLTFL